MVFCHTSDWFPFKELTVSTHTHCRSGCVQRESFIQEPLHNCSEAIIYPGLVIQHGHQPCPSVLSSKREACFKHGFQEISFFSLWFCLCRTWRTNLPKGACALLLTSVDHDRAPVVGVRVNVLLSRYLIEPCGSGKSKLTYLCRADVRYVLSLIFGMVKVMEKIETFCLMQKNGLNECIVVSWYSMKNGAY